MSTSKIVLIGIASVIALIVLSFVLGLVGVEYTKTVEKTQAKAQSEVRQEAYVSSQTYIDGSIKELADYKRQWFMTKSEDDKMAIETVIRDKFSNFDQSKINNPGLVSFLNNVLNGTTQK